MESYLVACSVKRRVTPFWNKRPGSEPLNNQNNQKILLKPRFFGSVAKLTHSSSKTIKTRFFFAWQREGCPALRAAAVR
jgi:hypothetical protein